MNTLKISPKITRNLGRFRHNGSPTISYAENFRKKKIALKGLQVIILFGGHANLVGPENNIFIFSW